MNSRSSRSHLVAILKVQQKKSGVNTVGKLYVCDLAGSEMVRKTEAEGKRLQEAKAINRSLSALGNVINALTQSQKNSDEAQQSLHVPYRDSKLTRLLQDSLGGNAKTALIVTASCSSVNINETLSTLRFGTRAKRLRNKPRVNAERSVSEYKKLLKESDLRVGELASLVQELNDEISELKARISHISSAVGNPTQLLRMKGGGGGKRAQANRQKEAFVDDDDDDVANDDDDEGMNFVPVDDNDLNFLAIEKDEEIAALKVEVRKLEGEVRKLAVLDVTAQKKHQDLRHELKKAKDESYNQFTAGWKVGSTAAAKNADVVEEQEEDQEEKENDDEEFLNEGDNDENSIFNVIFKKYDLDQIDQPNTVIDTIQDEPGESISGGNDNQDMKVSLSDSKNEKEKIEDNSNVINNENDIEDEDNVDNFLMKNHERNLAKLMRQFEKDKKRQKRLLEQRLRKRKESRKIEVETQALDNVEIADVLPEEIEVQQFNNFIEDHERNMAKLLEEFENERIRQKRLLKERLRANRLKRGGSDGDVDDDFVDDVDENKELEKFETDQKIAEQKIITEKIIAVREQIAEKFPNQRDAQEESNTIPFGVEVEVEGKDDEEENERICHICGLSEKETKEHDEVENNSSDKLGELFVCDGNCSTYIHTSCAGLEGVPTGEWFCSSCTTNDLVGKIDDPLPSPMRKEHDDFESAAAASLAELSAVRGRFVALRKQRDRLIARWKAERETQRRVEGTKRKLRRKREEEIVRLREVILVLQEEVNMSSADRAWLMQVMDATVTFSPSRIKKHQQQKSRRGSDFGALPSSIEDKHDPEKKLELVIPPNGIEDDSEEGPTAAAVRGDKKDNCNNKADESSNKIVAITNDTERHKILISEEITNLNKQNTAAKQQIMRQQRQLEKYRQQIGKMQSKLSEQNTLIAEVKSNEKLDSMMKDSPFGTMTTSSSTSSSPTNLHSSGGELSGAAFKTMQKWWAGEDDAGYEENNVDNENTSHVEDKKEGGDGTYSPLKRKESFVRTEGVVAERANSMSAPFRNRLAGLLSSIEKEASDYSALKSKIKDENEKMLKKRGDRRAKYTSNNNNNNNNNNSLARSESTGAMMFKETREDSQGEEGGGEIDFSKTT